MINIHHYFPAYITILRCQLIYSYSLIRCSIFSKYVCFSNIQTPCNS
ncbi:hypothetical protein A5884_000891, partial [Enterococcus sp. 7D2_DIV0200]